MHLLFWRRLSFAHIDNPWLHRWHIRCQHLVNLDLLFGSQVVADTLQNHIKYFIFSRTVWSQNKFGQLIELLWRDHTHRIAPQIIQKELTVLRKITLRYFAVSWQQVPVPLRQQSQEQPVFLHSFRCCKHEIDELIIWEAFFRIVGIFSLTEIWFSHFKQHPIEKLNHLFHSATAYLIHDHHFLVLYINTIKHNDDVSLGDVFWLDFSVEREPLADHSLRCGQRDQRACTV